jgi:hypothetical protein
MIANVKTELRRSKGKFEPFHEKITSLNRGNQVKSEHLSINFETPSFQFYEIHYQAVHPAFTGINFIHKSSICPVRRSTPEPGEV